MRSGSQRSGRRAAPRRGRPPGKTSDATRQRILAAACECFGARGYETTTNRDIGDRAGVTAAALYQYFDSKLVLYIEAVREAHREIVPFFRRAVDGAPTAREALVALTRAYAEAYDLFPALTPFLAGIGVEIHRHPEIAAAMLAEPSAVLQLIADIVEGGAASGEFDRERSSAVISMFLATTMGLSLHAALAGKMGLGEAVDAYTRLLEGRLFEGAAPGKARTARKKR